MKLPIYTRAGAESGRTVELDEAVFGVEPNDHVIWLDVRSIQAAGRQGTHKTKERAEVSYSTRKLFRQKGTGGARRGSRKSPLLRKGGTIFGPRPHDYVVRVNRKTKQLARRSAIAHKLRDEALRVLEDLSFDAPKTRDMAAVIRDNGLTDRKVLLLTAAHDENTYRSGRNLPKVSVLPATTASTVDLLGAQMIVLTEGAVEALTEALRPAEKPVATDIVETAQPAEAPVAKAPKAPKPKKAKPAPADDEAAAEGEAAAAPMAEEPAVEATTEEPAVEAITEEPAVAAVSAEEAAPVAEAAPEPVATPDESDADDTEINEETA